MSNERPMIISSKNSFNRNIAIDLTQIPADKTGVGVHAFNIVRELIRLNSNSSNEHPFTFYFFTQDDDKEWTQLIGTDPNSHLISINSKVFRKLILRFFFEQIRLPLRCSKLNIDTILSFHYTMPYLTRIKRMVIFADMTFYLFPELHQKIKRIYFKTLIPLSLKHSSKIITVSESTKKDVLKQFSFVRPDKISVIHHGVNIEGAPANAADYLDKYSLTSKNYFLYVGTLEPRKNIPSIIEAFRHVLDTSSELKTNFKLVIAGKKGWFYEKIFEAVSKYKLESQVVFTGYISEEEKRALLANAFGFVYPSFYEGFGIPILEAMAYGVPVITGNISSLPEVAGHAAILINPNHWQEIAVAMTRLLTDSRLVEDLSVKSIQQAQKFTWENAALKMMELWKQ